MDEVFPKPAIRTYSRTQKATKNTRENNPKENISKKVEVREGPKASKKDKPNCVPQHKTLSSKVDMKAAVKVTDWLEKSKDWMKKTDNCSPQDSEDYPSIEIMRGEENVSGAERRKKLFSSLELYPSCLPLKSSIREDPHIETSKQNFLESLTQRKPALKRKKRDDTPAGPSLLMTTGSQLTDMGQTESTLYTCDQPTEETVSGYPDTTVTDEASTLVPTIQSSTKGRHSSTNQTSHSMQVTEKVRKYLSSTGKSNISVTPQFSELSAITSSDPYAAQKIAETTPKKPSDFKVPKSPSKYQTKSQRRGTLERKHSTKLFASGCAEIVDAFSSMSPITPVSSKPDQGQQTEPSPEIEDLQKTAYESNRVKTSTPNKHGKQANLNYFEVDVSSVEVDSDDEILAFDRPSREINSEEIINLSDVMIDPNEGPLSKPQDIDILIDHGIALRPQRTNRDSHSANSKEHHVPIVTDVNDIPNKDEQDIVTSGVRVPASDIGHNVLNSDVEMIPSSVISTNANLDPVSTQHPTDVSPTSKQRLEHHFDNKPKSSRRSVPSGEFLREQNVIMQRMRRVEKFLNSPSLVEKCKLLRYKRVGKQSRGKSTNSKPCLLPKKKRHAKICTLMNENFVCPLYCKIWQRWNERIPTDYNAFLRSIPPDDLL